MPSLQRNVMPQPIEYLAIRLGEMMKSARSFIMSEQERAAEANAPLDSIYFGGGKWVSINEITDPDTRRRLEERLKKLRTKSRRKS